MTLFKSWLRVVQGREYTRSCLYTLYPRQKRKHKKLQMSCCLSRSYFELYPTESPCNTTRSEWSTRFSLTNLIVGSSPTSLASSKVCLAFQVSESWTKIIFWVSCMVLSQLFLPDLGFWANFLIKKKRVPEREDNELCGHIYDLRERHCSFWGFHLMHVEEQIMIPQTYAHPVHKNSRKEHHILALLERLRETFSNRTLLSVCLWSLRRNCKFVKLWNCKILNF